MSCFNRINGCGCAMKCTNGNDERYPLVDNGKGGQKCTCVPSVCVHVKQSTDLTA